MNRLQRLRRLEELRARQHAIAGAKAQCATAALRQAEEALQQCREERQGLAEIVSLAVSGGDQDGWLKACAESELTLVRQGHAALHCEHAAIERKRMAEQEVAARRTHRQMELAVKAVTAKSRREDERKLQQQLDEMIRLVSRHLLLRAQSE